jgi:hypothetical protein
MRFAIIENGKVVNLAVSDKALAANWQPCDESVKIGDAWTGKDFSRVSEPVKVPTVVSMRQARLALLNVGKLALVDAAIQNMTSPQREKAQIYWEYSIQVGRYSPMTLAIGTAVGLTSAEIDSLFIEAALL